MTMCNHFFCLAPARAYSRHVAEYKVTQYLPMGWGVRTTYVCDHDMVEMRKILGPNDIVEVL